MSHDIVTRAHKLILSKLLLVIAMRFCCWNISVQQALLSLDLLLAILDVHIFFM